MKAKIVMDYKLAHAIGTDAGNARMRKHGRTRWNRADYLAACRAMEKALKLIPKQ